MTAYRDEIVGLINDASLVSAYAARFGQLQEPDLMATASRLEASLQTGSPTPDDYTTFLRQFNSAVHAIAPVTLIDLGSAWRPFPGTVEYKWFNRFLVLVGVIMIALIAFYTQLYTIAKDTLVTIHAVQLAAIDDKLDTLKIFLAEHPALVPDRLPQSRQPGADLPDLRKSPSQQDIEAARAVLSNYLKDLRVLNGLASEMQTAIFTISQEDVLYPPLVLPVYRGLSHLLYGRDTTLAATSASTATPPSLSQEQYLESLNADPNKRKALVAQDTVKDNSDPALAYGLYGLVSMRAVAPRESDYIDFCKRVVLLLGGWFLPAAYGLVGSIVFQMRRVLNPLQPGLPPIRLVFRIALGGFAGIIVSWFWSPSAQSIAIGESIGITTFGIAFLVGYSSEIFFVLLDTMVTALLAMISRKPAVGARS